MMEEKAMSSKHYIQSDGNGGLNIGKHTVAIIISVLALLFTISGALASQVYSYGKLSEKVEHNTEGYLDLKTSIEDTKLIDNSEFTQYKDKVSGCETKVAVIETKLDNIETGINEIKEIVKNK